MARKRRHEIRDPIHVFIRLDTNERKVLDSRPFQRLRHIHQLALTYLVYPGATHRRFEHSLGVMELASRIYDVITRPENIHFESVRNILPEYDSMHHKYWRHVLRMAALCHDLGHLPFSHGAEKELLPEGWNHERITGELIRSEVMNTIWKNMEVPLRARDIEKIALGPKEMKTTAFSDWEAILAEIIVGDTFGADRIDYLLRDSLHTGVDYGRFDHYRLIDTLRILPKSQDSAEPTLGLELGGIQSAEALLWARYFMFSQVYFHPVRRIYDIHLADFLKHWLVDGKFSVDIDGHLAMTDSEVIVALRQSAFDTTNPVHLYAERIIMRKHFKLLYERNPPDLETNPDAPKAVFDAACEEFGADHVRYDSYRQKGGGKSFPVRAKDNNILQSVALSDTLEKVPIVAADFVFIDGNLREKVRRWLDDKRPEILEPQEETEE